MALATIISRKYTNPYDPQSSSFLIGNVGDVIGCEMQFDVLIDSTSTSANPYTVTNNDTITRVNGSWYDDGFIVGATLTITADNNGTPVNVTADILTVTPSVMTVNVTAGTLLDGEYPSVADNNSDMYIVSNSLIQGIEFEFALIYNSQSQNGKLTSLIDGTVTTFGSNSIGGLAVSGTEELSPIGERSGHSIFKGGLAFSLLGIERGGPVVTYEGVFSGKQRYKINYVFIITPFWENLTDLENATNPTYYAGRECITDSVNIKFFPEVGNPNNVVEPDISQLQLQGNTGWFNENRNGGINLFPLASLELSDPLSGVPLSGIKSNAETRFSITLDRPNGTATSEYSINWLWTPTDTTIYQNNKDPFHENCMLCMAGGRGFIPLTESTPSQVYGGFKNRKGAKMDIDFDSITHTVNTVTIKGKFKPNGNFGNYIDSLGGTDLNYIIWVSVGDDTLTTTTTDRVSVLVEYGEMVTTAGNIQSFDVSNSFLNHAQDPTQVGISSYLGCVEDEMIGRSIIRVDTANNEVLEEIRLSIEGYNIVTNERYTLETNTYDLTVFPADVNGIQQVNIDTTRGFLMASGVNKNEVKMSRSPIDDIGTLLGYRCNYAFRMNWEDWIANTNVPSDFFNSALLNNGLNNDWANKEDAINWLLTYNVNLRVNRGGSIINTRNSFDFSVRDYEESIIWDGEITHFDDTKTNSLFLGVNADGIRENAITTNDNTWVQADFDLEDPFGDVGDINDYYGVIRMEEYRNGGLFAIHMLSTILTNETTNNLLVPLTGETATKITKVSATKIRLECYIDKDKIDPNVAQYKLSARIGGKEINVGKYSSHYALKYN
jgi:hypothetical protein